MTEKKPLFWEPTPGIGYSVSRSDNGGMILVFSDLTDDTIAHWYDFALEHLMESDRLTRNLYDLRQVSEVPEQAIRKAIEVNSDPAARNIRAAVVVANSTVADAIRKVAGLALTESSAAIRIFTDMQEAEAWLEKPLDTMI